MAVDETMRKLNIPQNYAPYLQKMGVYDFFYDIAVTYALNQPEDHVIFLRNYLCSLQDKAVQIKILIIGSPHIDKRTLADEIAEKLNLLVISLKDIQDENTELEYSPKTFAMNLEKIIQQKMGDKSGWILYDYPRDRLEGRAMRRRAINPTHTFQLVPSPQYYTKRDLWNENLIDKDPQEFREMIECYKRRLVELKATFGDTIKEVVIRGRTLPQIAKSCVISAKQLLPKGGASIPRVVVIGEISKKIENVAKDICKQFDLIFINMEEVVCQGKKLDNELGEHLRELEKRQVPIYGKLVLALVQNRLMSIDCLNEGWIMINFPRDRIDFEALDTFDTPPNRVIFLIPADINKRELFREWVALKPRDYAAELRDEACKKEQSSRSGSSEHFYNSLSPDQIRDLLEYCGRHSAFVDSRLPYEDLIEIFTKIVLEQSPKAPVRVPPTKEELRKHLLTAVDSEIDICEEYHKVDSARKLLPDICSESSPALEIVYEDSKQVVSDASSCLEVFPWKPKLKDDDKPRDEILDILDPKEKSFHKGDEVKSIVTDLFN